MKKKILLKSLFSIFGIASVCVPFIVQKDIYSLNNTATNLNDDSTQTSSATSNPILSDDVQDVNQATQNGFIGKTATTVFSSDFYGESLWSYDLTTSPFLQNDDGTQKTVTNFLVKYNKYNDTVAVVGSYTAENGSDQSFFFQLYASTGLPYFSNEDPTLTDQQKYNESVITSEKDPNLTKDPSTIIFNGNYATVFNENVLKDSTNNKPCQINVLTLDTIQLTFDQTFFTGITTTYTSNVFLGATILADGNILVTTGQVNSSNKLQYVRAFLLTSTLKSVMYNGSAARLTLVSPTAGGYLSAGVYSTNDVIRDIFITSGSGTQSTITYIFMGTAPVFRSFLYDSSTHLLSTANTSYLSNQGVSSISYLTEDTINKKIYFTTTTSGKTLMSFDNSTYTFSTLSDNTNFSGAKVATFLPSTTCSQLVLEPTSDTTGSTIYGFQTNIGGNNQGEVSITVPQISDYTATAQSQGLYDKLPSDITSDEAVKVLQITNYSSSNYTVTLVDNSMVADDENGTLSFTLNLGINDWWDQAHPNKFTSTRNVSLTGLPSIVSQRFQLVTNASINASKYNQVYNLQQTIYLSDLTKEEILDYFIDYGNGLSFTTNDISLNGDISGAQIQATTDNNTGELTISYSITANQDKTSLSDEYKSGSKTWQFEKCLNNYKQLQINPTLLGVLKTSEYAADVTLDDLVSSIDFAASGTGYSTDVSNWKWTPTYQVGSTEWINEQLNGELDGTLQYIRTQNDPPASEVPDAYFTVKIDETGFLKLSDYILGTKDASGNYPSPFNFNQDLADSLTVTSDKNEATQNLREIINQTVTTNNSWIPSNQINYSVDQFDSTNTQLVVYLNIPNNAKTNISLGDSSNITLNDNWVAALKALSPSLFDSYKITLNISIATYSWNVQKANQNSSITINDVNSSQLDAYKNKLPSTFASDLASNPSDFQSITNLLNLSNDLNSNGQSLQADTSSSSNGGNVGDFYIQSIQLTPNDEAGSVTASYILVYPNLNNVSKVATVTISGFLSIWDVIIFWIIIVVVIALICVAIWLIVSYYKKNYKKKRIWSTHNFMKKFKKVKN